MARGGRRKGTPGQAYPNRTDLAGPAKPMVVPGQGYGEQGKQVAAQKALPMGTPTVPKAMPTPDDVPSLLGGVSVRPNEPLTAGLPSGAGPGPEAIGFASGVAQPRPGFDDLEAIYQAFPFPGIRALIRWGGK